MRGSQVTRMVTQLTRKTQIKWKFGHCCGNWSENKTDGVRKAVDLTENFNKNMKRDGKTGKIEAQVTFCSGKVRKIAMKT